MRPQPSGHLTVAPSAPDGAVDAAEPTLSSAATVTALPPAAIPSGRGPSGATLAALAALAAAAAAGLGGWALVAVDGGPSSLPSARETALERAVVILASPGVVTLPFSASVGRIALIVDDRGDAVLRLNGLGRAPSGLSYQAWVTPPGAPGFASAALFDGSEQFVPLDLPVPPGSRVSVTLELAGGAIAPTRTPRLTADRF